MASFLSPAWTCLTELQPVREGVYRYDVQGRRYTSGVGVAKIDGALETFALALERAEPRPCLRK